ncbi:spirocyclase AveC family protein [Kitasatospora sp. NBC_00315]|uniref:spirocyclase AveC family protein n=1 Tax=Kitasatospora sp. NBC_00315 TaxID=2975963 RepID=UPI003253FF80
MTQSSPPPVPAAVVTVPTQGTVEHGRAAPDTRRGPVLWWAAAGAVFLALQCYVFVRWAADGGYHLLAVPGPDDGTAGAGTGHRRVVDVLLPALSVAGVVGLAVSLVRRGRTERRLSFDALLFAGVLFAGWLSPLMNWFHPVLIANTHVWGALSSWGPYVPGWRGLPPGMEAELPLVTFSLGSTVLLGVLGCCQVMTRARDRWPGIRPWQLVGLAFLTAVVFDLSEPFISFAGVSVWSRALPAVTLWSGAWYQFPLYQLVGTGLASGSLSAIRFFRDERDETVVERGAWRLPGRIRPWVRFLAVVGTVNAVMLGYAALQALLSLAGGQPPAGLPEFFGPPAAY